MTIPAVPPAILSSSDLRTEGLSHRDAGLLVERRELERLRRDRYVRPSWEPGGLDHREQHRLEIRAHVSAVCDDAVVSHWSAAVLHGLPFWNGDLDRVHLTRSRSHGGRRRTRQHVHPTPWRAEEIVLLDGVPVTTAARTVIDLARHTDLRRGVAVADAALAKGVRADELEEVLGWSRRRPGMRTARHAVRLADGRSESVGESVSRVVLHQLGVPPTDLQYEVIDTDGLTVGRADFCWEDHRTLGEFDGRIKYDGLVPEGRSAREVIYAEKRREDALRSLGWEVVRWSWDDLAHPERILAALHRAFTRAALRRG
ncbi:putative transcriptional regulator of viral defense system [Friedmanniella endophytica]|uniref:Putative transcriptional regulator of viral defense system n=1 Tax=Microlunatus kandeliicorticis TaxID=1759536 RepID=A0A7W3IQ48_9ACTN|nr:hypothetical protein [Microlunatus kandeliicorticis]MBA8793206.1 putative transcriptional regulator of viral defense system [Microlunatus kandeliicorticis]